MKFNIPDEVKKASGIYMIKSSLDERVYIGKAKNLYTRYLTHRKAFCNGAHDNLLMQELVNVHSLEIFEFNLVELCETKMLHWRELHHIEQHLALFQGYGFNIIAGGADMRGFGEEYKLNAHLIPALMEKFGFLKYRQYHTEVNFYRDRVQILEEAYRGISKEFYALAAKVEEYKTELQKAKTKADNKKLKARTQRSVLPQYKQLCLFTYPDSAPVVIQ